MASEIKDWLPLLIMLAGLAATYGRLSERIGSLVDLVKRIEAKEDARGVAERAVDRKIVELEADLRSVREQLTEAREEYRSRGEQVIAEIHEIRRAVQGKAPPAK